MSPRLVVSTTRKLKHTIMASPTIYLATDHAGLPLKNAVKDWLVEEGFTIEDCGAYEYDPHDDFPDFIKLAAKAVAKNPKGSKAIIFGGSGQGEAMLANRFPGVRAAVYYDGPPEIVTLSRQHNDANILSIGARFISTNKAKEAIWAWLHTEALADEKYARRNQKLDEIN